MIYFIEGKNFGEAYEKGEIFLGNQEINTKFWSEDKIIIAIPIMDKLGEYDLRLINKYGNQQKKNRLEIKDPSEVL
jgi:hypothetical protein